jgi:hypothetical protein
MYTDFRKFDFSHRFNEKITSLLIVSNILEPMSVAKGVVLFAHDLGFVHCIICLFDQVLGIVPVGRINRLILPPILIVYPSRSILRYVALCFIGKTLIQPSFLIIIKIYKLSREHIVLYPNYFCGNCNCCRNILVLMKRND